MCSSDLAKSDSRGPLWAQQSSSCIDFNLYFGSEFECYFGGGIISLTFLITCGEGMLLEVASYSY